MRGKRSLSAKTGRRIIAALKLNKSEKRIAELDTIIKKLYKSFAVGHITDERFDTACWQIMKLSRKRRLRILTRWSCMKHGRSSVLRRKRQQKSS